jgi:uncharacterized membrane protein YccC
MFRLPATMTEAIFGLVGVLVGGLISGGATFLMTRRSERRRGRAAVRLVQAELRHGATLAESILPPLLDDAFAGNRQMFEHLQTALADLPASSAWNAHKGELAELLNARDWYALAESYEALEALRHLDVRQITTDDGRIYHTSIRDVLLELLDDLKRGVRASAAMTRTAEEERPRSALRTYFVATTTELDHLPAPPDEPPSGRT